MFESVTEKVEDPPVDQGPQECLGCRNKQEGEQPPYFAGVDFVGPQCKQRYRRRVLRLDEEDHHLTDDDAQRNVWHREAAETRLQSIEQTQAGCR